MTTITKDKYYEFPEYHTSLDNLDYVNGNQILEAFKIYQRAIEILDGNRILESQKPHGEVHLSSHGLYPTVGGSISQKGVGGKLVSENQRILDAILWVLFLADGSTDIIDIAERAGLGFAEVKQAVTLLKEKGLVRSK